jgi:flagellar protein FlaG
MDIPAVVNNSPSGASATLGKPLRNAAPDSSASAEQLSRTVDAKENRDAVQKETRDRVELTRDQAEELAKRIESQINIERRSLSFQLNENIGKTVVSVIDVKTDEVIRQIPSEDLVRLAEQIERLRADQGSSEKDLAGVFLEAQA